MAYCSLFQLQSQHQIYQSNFFKYFSGERRRGGGGGGVDDDGSGGDNNNDDDAATEAQRVVSG